MRLLLENESLFGQLQYDLLKILIQRVIKWLKRTSAGRWGVYNLSKLMFFVYFTCAPKPDSYDLWTDLFCIVLLVRQSHNDMVFKLILFAYFYIFAKFKIIWLLKWYFFYIFMGPLKRKSYFLEVTFFVRFCSCAKVKIKLFWRIFFLTS